MNWLIATIAIGLGATLVMDAWSWLRQKIFRMAPPNYALLGRWVAHMRQGRFYHAKISETPAVRGERLIGWLVHYLTGLVFALLLVAIVGQPWLQSPSLAPAVLFGLASVAAPFLLMQPGMGAGIAASRAPRPQAARWQSLLTHLVFGIGLYLSAAAIQLITSIHY